MRRDAVRDGCPFTSLWPVYVPVHQVTELSGPRPALCSSLGSTYLLELRFARMSASEGNGPTQSAIVIQTELVRMRTYAYSVRLVLFNLQPFVDKIVGKDSADFQELLVFLEREDSMNK
jgi:hypothetical protein